MPLKLEFRPNGAIFWGYGVLTGPEVLHANREVYSHIFEPVCRFQLAVNTRVTDFLLTADEVRQLAAMDAELAPKHHQIAIGVAESDYLYGMMRMWNMQAESANFETHIVRTIDEALSLYRDRGIDLGTIAYPPGCDEPAGV